MRKQVRSSFVISDEIASGFGKHADKDYFFFTPINTETTFAEEI